jgi:hypothetical protein
VLRGPDRDGVAWRVALGVPYHQSYDMRLALRLHEGFEDLGGVHISGEQVTLREEHLGEGINVGESPPSLGRVKPN